MEDPLGESYRVAAEDGDEVPRLELRVPWQSSVTERHIIGSLSCCGIIGLGAFAGLVVLLNCIHTLGPEEQVLVESLNGRYVRNGPCTVVLAPERKKTFRQATKLVRTEYAVIKNIRSGEIRHHPGPSLVFLGPYEVVDEIRKVILLQRDEYMRLVDKMTGNERVVAGPKAVIPNPLETSPKGVETAAVLGFDVALVVLMRTTGMLRLVTNGGAYFPEPYEDAVEVRRATVLTPKQYAIIKSNLDGSVRQEAGPKRFQVGPYEELLDIKDKLVLRKDEYIRLRNKIDGSERIVRGPQVFIPDYFEKTLEGKQRATFLDVDTAALVLNRATGQQRLITQKGVFMPSPYEQILEKRVLNRVLPHEAMVVRDPYGQTYILGADDSSTTSSFFLKPHWSIHEMTWSSFSEDLNETGAEQNLTKVVLTKIDKRAQKMLFRYGMLSADSAKLRLDGTIFWRVTSVGAMLNTTSDPSGDIWHHARSTLLQAVSKTTLATFMLNLKTVVAVAFRTQAQDGFYAERGLEVESIEVTRFEVADPETAVILGEIIAESTNRINRLKQQTTSDEVAVAKLTQDISLEKIRTELVISHATNARLQAEMDGDVEGLRRLGFATKFIGGLNNSVADLETRLELYKQYQELESQNIMTRDIAAGGNRLILTPKDLDLGLRIEL